MEKKLFYLSDSETRKPIPIEAVKEEHQSQWKSQCAKCKGSNQTVTINDKQGIFHCYGCGWHGVLNHLDRLKQPTIHTDKKTAPLLNPGKKNQSSTVIEPIKAEKNKGRSFLSHYLRNGFLPLHCNGYHPEKNQEKDPERAYKMAKKPTYAGWNKSNYVAPTHEEIDAWEKAGGWIGWRIPEGAIYLDVEDQEDTDNVKKICHLKNITPGIHQTNKGLHFGFSTDQHYPADSTVFTKSGIKLTYRVGGKNYLILAPTNKRRWQAWKDIKELPALPDQLKPYDRKNMEDVLNCLSRSVRSAYRVGDFSGYEDLDAAYMALLINCKLSEEMIHNSFKIVFREKYDEKQTNVMCERTKTRIKNGDPVLGTGTFIQRVKEQKLDEVQRFTRELQTFIGTVVEATSPHQLTETPNKLHYKITTIDEILNYPDPEYLIDKIIIKETLTILASYAGVGKSIIALSIAKAIMTGRPLWNRFQVLEKGSVLLIDEETPRPFLKERVSRMKFDPDLPFPVIHFQGVKVDSDEGMEALEEALNKVNPKVLIIDSFIRIHSADENKTKDMARVMDKLRKIVNRGITVILIAHHGKGEDRPITEKLRGVSEIPAGIDIEYSLIDKTDGEAAGVKIVEFRSVKTRTKPVEPILLRITFPENGEEEITIDYQGTKAGDALEEIKNVLREKEINGQPVGELNGATYSKIEDWLRERGVKVGQKSLRTILRDAVKNKEILSKTDISAKGQPSLYWLPESGVTMDLPRWVTNND